LQDSKSEDAETSLTHNSRATANPTALEVEAHSIEFVPLSERYGRPIRLFTIWFSVNISIVCAAAGALGVNGGLSFSWTFLAVVLGNGIGTIVMAAHSAQGPHLGVPQMIQSRAQFGVLGAALPLIAVVITYMLYTAADGLVVEKTINTLLGVTSNTSLIIFGAITLLVSYIGYELIHRIAAILAVLSALLFLTVAVIFMWHGGTASVPHPVHGGFNREVFMATITQAAGWSLSFGPYVADYSRYLSPNVKTSTTFWYTAAGCFLGAVLTMAFGAYIAISDSTAGDDLGGIIVSTIPGLHTIVRLVIVFGVLVGNVMNVYSAYMSTATIFAGIRKARVLTKSTKFLTMTVVTTLSTAIAWLGQGHFDQYFGDVLGIMVYMLVPWSAINLADYYLVRHGRYDVRQFYELRGIYGVFRWRTIAIYAVSILAEAPFMSLTGYKGPMARLLDADLAWAVGLIVSGACYVAVERGRLLRHPSKIRPLY
jgi:nucleobase:cation symporter-1, NCS1 family